MALSTVSFVFATGESWLDSLVTTVTKSRWSHVSLRFESENILAEALVGRGFLLQPGGKYDSFTVSESIRKYVPEAVQHQMLERCRGWSQIQVPYGYRTCAAIGIKELFGWRAGRLALEWLPAEEKETLVCSEMIVKLWRMAVPDFLSGSEPRLVSPNELYHALQSSGDSGTKIDKQGNCAYNC